MLTRREVEAILGRCEDLRAAEIISSGTTAAELVEAKRWTEGYGRTLGADQPLRPAVVMRLADLLAADELETEDE